MTTTPISLPAALFSSYPPAWQPERIEGLQREAGFSGGAVWRAVCPAGCAALRCWAPGYPAERVSAIHRLLYIARHAGCGLVPQPIVDRGGRTWNTWDERHWEMCTWMPGVSAAYEPQGDRERVIAAVEALAQWHTAMTVRRTGTAIGPLAEPAVAAAFCRGERLPSPGLQRRVQEWHRLRRLVEEVNVLTFQDPYSLAERTRQLARRLTEPMQRWLANADQPVELAVCLRDVHAEHVLFTGTRVTGLVDFGAMGLDTPACDLARLLGSLVPDDPEQWRSVSAAFEQVAHPQPRLAELAWRFDHTGAVIGALHWLEWLIFQRRAFHNRDAAYSRWRSLVERLESWNDDSLKSGP